MVQQRHIHISIAIVIQATDATTITGQHQPPLEGLLLKAAIALVDKQSRQRRKVLFGNTRIMGFHLLTLFTVNDIVGNVAKAIHMENIQKPIIIEVGKAGSPAPVTIRNSCLPGHVFQQQLTIGTVVAV